MTDKRSKTSALNGKQGGRPKELLNFKAVEGENWRPVKWGDAYFVSDHGRVISIKSGKPKLLKLITLNTRYKTVHLSMQEKRKISQVQCLVLEAFKGPRPKKFQASHLDGTRDNNNINNLVWESAKDNGHRRIGHGTQTRGEACGRKVLTNKMVLEIRRLHDVEGLSQRSIGRLYRMPYSNIRRIVLRHTWNHI